MCGAEPRTGNPPPPLGEPLSEDWLLPHNRGQGARLCVLGAHVLAHTRVYAQILPPERACLGCLWPRAGHGRCQGRPGLSARSIPTVASCRLKQASPHPAGHPPTCPPPTLLPLPNPPPPYSTPEGTCHLRRDRPASARRQGSQTSPAGGAGVSAGPAPPSVSSRQCRPHSH